MKLYILWKTDENRPALMQTNYGSLVVFLTKEQMQAYRQAAGASHEENYETREIEI